MSKGAFYFHYIAAFLLNMLVAFGVLFTAKYLFHLTGKFTGIASVIVVVNVLGFNALKQAEAGKLSLRKFYGGLLLAAFCGSVIAVSLSAIF